MNLYNTLTRKIDEVTPANDNVIKMYSCGPTVYDAMTIGNWTAYIRWDILARTLQSAGYTLDWYMNITDVGHLVSDADTGEDKLEKGAKREGVSAWDIAKKYTDDFIEGLDKLLISIDKSHLVKATDHIDQQIKLIQKLEDKGCTYVIGDGVYFDSSTFPNYGQMARLDLEGLKAGARVDIGDKRNLTDFALWKFSPKDSSRDMEWDSPWGKGFPGWHIECSAMALEYLGSPIDIHTGGIDHIPVHHTNEIAQSEMATDKKFVNVWVHSNFLQVDGQKLSKSLDNGYTLQDLRSKGFEPLDFKLLVLQSSYQSESNFTWEGLQAAKSRKDDIQALADLRFQSTVEGLDVGQLLNEAASSIKKALQSNLQTPLVLLHLSDLVDRITSSLNNSSNIKLGEFFTELDTLLGFDFSASEDISEHQKHLIAERETARHNKDWSRADNIRKELSKKQIAINDTPSGPVWRRL